MPKKTATCIIRLSEQDNLKLDIKSSFLGLSKSDLLRKGAFFFPFGDSKSNAAFDRILQLYKEADGENKKLIVDLLAEYYSLRGYPHNKLSNKQKIREMIKISQSKSPLLEEDLLQTNTLGLALCNFYHPHMVEVRCGKYRTPYEQFSDPELLRDAIKRWMDINNKPSHSGVRRILRIRDGVRSVVNFKPVIAKYIYDTYCPSCGKVLDPCSGYSGRLAGCIAGNRNLFYHGIDPDGRTAAGNMKMAAFFSRQWNILEREWRFGFRFDLGCAEEIMPQINEKYDLVATSPPYFHVEKYSSEPSQSYVKFPKYEIWKEKFLFVIINETYRILKDGGYFVLNIKNCKKMPMADHSIEMAENCGLSLIKTYRMKMPNSEYNLLSKDHPDFEKSITWHSEPIFVFQKTK